MSNQGKKTRHQWLYRSAGIGAILNLDCFGDVLLALTYLNFLILQHHRHMVRAESPFALFVPVPVPLSRVASLPLQSPLADSSLCGGRWLDFRCAQKRRTATAVVARARNPQRYSLLSRHNKWDSFRGAMFHSEPSRDSLLRNRQMHVNNDLGYTSMK